MYISAAQAHEELAQEVAQSQPEPRARSTSPLAAHRESQEFKEDEVAKMRLAVDSNNLPQITVGTPESEKRMTSQDSPVKDAESPPTLDNAGDERAGSPSSGLFL